MKKFIIVLIVLVCACDNSEVHKPNTDIMPLTVGSKWVHEITTQFPIYDNYELNTDVIGIDSLGYSIVHRSYHNVLEEPYLINKSDGVYRRFGITDVLQLKFPVELGESYDLSQSTVTISHTDTNITVEAGSFNCYLYNYYANSVRFQQSFYGVGVGLVKQINYAADSSIVRLTELKSFQVK